MRDDRRRRRAAGRPGSAARSGAGRRRRRRARRGRATMRTGGSRRRCYTRRAWKGPKEPPRHVGVDAIAAVSIVRPLRAGAQRYGRRPSAVNGARPRMWRRDRSSYPPSVHSRVGSVPRAGQSAGRPVDGVERVELAVEPGQHEPAADQLGRGDDVASGRPARPTVPSGSSANVSISAWTRTWRQPRRAEQRDDRRRRAVVPAQLAGRRVQAVGVEPVGHDEQSGSCPSRRPRLVEDGRGEPGGPRARAGLRAGARRGTGRPGRR